MRIRVSNEDSELIFVDVIKALKNIFFCIVPTNERSSLLSEREFYEKIDHSIQQSDEDKVIS